MLHQFFTDMPRLVNQITSYSLLLDTHTQARTGTHTQIHSNSLQINRKIKLYFDTVKTAKLEARKLPLKQHMHSQSYSHVHKTKTL